MNQNESSRNESSLPIDADILPELLDDVDTFAALVGRVQSAVKKGKTEVRLIPRGQVYTIAQALDEIEQMMMRRTDQIRQFCEIRDNIADTTPDAS